MRSFPSPWANLFCALALAAGCPVRAANLPVGWQHQQQFDLSAPGLVKLSLPVETLDAARPALEDLRLYDDAGNELPYLIQHPLPAASVVQTAKSFQVSLNPSTTVITLETGMAPPLDGVTLESPANSFIKSVQIESSDDGRTWQTLARGRSIFRQPNGANQIHLPLPSGTRPWLRLTVDDQRTSPIPFTGARVHATESEPAPGESLPVIITERHENPGETRFTLNLGAANLNLASLQIETDEPLFTRAVTLAVPQVLEDAIQEQSIAQATIYRVAVEGQPASANLSVPLEGQVRSRELLLLINNQDSPPLPITQVRAVRRPVYLVFSARQSGPHHLLMGNRLCTAPRYDLAVLGVSLKNAAVAPLKISALTDNPDYRAPEVLPGLEANGRRLDVAPWKFRKPVKLARAGAQQLELDLDVLAHAQSGFQDLRLLRGSNQVPYLVQRTSISRPVIPSVTLTNDVKRPKSSIWILKLPKANLAAARLSCETRSPLFQREMTLYEEFSNERGDKYRRAVGSAVWTQTPGRKSREFALMLNERLQSDTLFLETENGDNPPIELEKFTWFYPVTRLLFKAQPADNLFLYYGNPRVASPRYDLNLVAGQLLTADKAPASLTAEEPLKKSSWRENQTPGKGGVMFWGILAGVVVTLLVIISRLLPKASPPA